MTETTPPQGTVQPLSETARKTALCALKEEAARTEERMDKWRYNSEPYNRYRDELAQIEAAIAELEQLAQKDGEP